MHNLEEVYSGHYDEEWDIVVWELRQWSGKPGYQLGLFPRDSASSMPIGEWDKLYDSIQEALAVVPSAIEYLKQGDG